MTEKRLVLGGIMAAVLLTGSVSAATGTPAVLAQTPVGAAIYLIVGVAVPQLLLGQRGEDAVRTGLGLLAGVAGGVMFVSGLFVEAPLVVGNVGFVDVLAVVVVGVILGTVVREFRRGYAGTDQNR